QQPPEVGDGRGGRAEVTARVRPLPAQPPRATRTVLDEDLQREARVVRPDDPGRIDRGRQRGLTLAPHAHYGRARVLTQEPLRQVVHEYGHVVGTQPPEVGDGLGWGEPGQFWPAGHRPHRRTRALDTDTPS